MYFRCIACYPLTPSYTNIKYKPLLLEVHSGLPQDSPAITQEEAAHHAGNLQSKKAPQSET